MGCNTSKETIPTTEEKDNVANNEGIKKVGENGEQTQIQENSANEKPDSAKTITANRSSTHNSRPTSAHQDTDQTKTVTKQIKEAVNGIAPTEELDQAAAKIQAAFRGHKTRKSMKQADKPEKAPNSNATEDMAVEFRADDPELCNAATKIQASFRGHMARKKVETGKPDGANCTESNDKNEEQQDEDFDIDLSDPDLNKAASKIQATFRTHMKHKDE